MTGLNCLRWPREWPILLFTHLCNMKRWPAWIVYYDREGVWVGVAGAEAHRVHHAAHKSRLQVHIGYLQVFKGYLQVHKGYLQENKGYLHKPVWFFSPYTKLINIVNLWDHYSGQQFKTIALVVMLVQVTKSTILKTEYVYC